MDILLAGNGPSLWKRRLPALMSSAATCGNHSGTKSNTIPGQAEKCSASARNPVRLQPGIVFGISPERCSASLRKSVRLRPESPPKVLIHRSGAAFVVPEPGVKIAISDLDRLQSVNLAQNVIGQIL
jgi:hypothetical protein